MAMIDEEELADAKAQAVSEAVHIFRLQYTELLEDIEHEIKGEVKKGDKWEPIKEPWANDAFINKYMSLLKICGLNKTINLGFLTDDQINLRCYNLGMELSYMMCVNNHKYDIDRCNRMALIHLLTQPIHSSLTRSLFGKEAKQISTQTQEHLIRQDRPKQASPLNPARILGRGEQ